MRERPESFIVRCERFDGSLGELAQALRTRRLMPKDIDLLELIRQFLAFFDAHAARDLELASEALPQLARVIELKVRLLLPRPKLEAEEEAALEETLAGVDVLAELEDAIHFLRLRREERRLVVAARVPRPSYPRREAPLHLPLARLAELAGQRRVVHYFELAVERITLASAIASILAGLRVWPRRFLGELAPGSWLKTSVHFAAMLELVKEGRVRARQDEAFGPIQLELLEAQAQEAA